MEELKQDTLGYSTTEALNKLRASIHIELNGFKQKHPIKLSILNSIVSFSSEKVLLSGVAYTIILVYIFCLILTYIFGQSAQIDTCLLWEALYLFLVLIINLIFALHEELLHKKEIPHRIKKVLETLDLAKEQCSWKEQHYPHLCAPFSPCVILQWTYRDGTIVNLPWALLVEGDIVVLRPGQDVPGHCKGLNSDDPELFFGQTYQPFSQICKRRQTTPCHNHVKSVLYPHHFKSADTNYGKNFERTAIAMFEQETNKTVMPSGLFIDLQNGFLGASPDGIVAGESAIVEVKCIPSVARTHRSVEKAATENKNFPSQLINWELTLKESHNYYYQTKENFTSPKLKKPHQNKAYKMCETPYLRNMKLALEQASHRPVTVFEKQRYLCTVKIMEGIVLPSVIIFVVIASVVRHFYNISGNTHWTEVFLLPTIAATLPLLQIIFPIAWIILNCYGLARFKLLSETRQKYARPKSVSISEDASDPLIQALSESSLKPETIKSLGKTFFNILTGREDMVTRTANIVHVLGSLSALCCVDKKGILSWPNPTAEKVFFLRNSGPTSANSSKTSLVGSMGQSQSTIDQMPDGRNNTESSTIAEVLDLTHDQNSAFCVEWDDQRWRRHLALLKPLGLAALLNTCSPAARHSYALLCAHITCEAANTEDLVPVTNRRCLCELAKQMGFTDGIADSYHVQNCLAMFRHLPPDTIRREQRFVRSLQLSTKVKVPLPHMLAVLVKDRANQLQMLSQGTADILLDSCVDYWNGKDLTPLSPSDRKKIIDFYQRNSLTAYCTAFAYKPLTRGISPSLSNMYLQLPPDSRQLYAPHSQHWSDAPALHFHSTDSLIFNEVTDDDVTDAEGFFDLQCNQVFIGMVTMQYQAQSDMVELIERLERACIRFVHFSKENELRSRVFSEKMGLESGWNCHISLMSEETQSSPLSSQTFPHFKERANNVNSALDSYEGPQRFFYSNISESKTLSMSAPGAINLDHTTVKFHSELKKPRHSITTHNGKAGRNSIPTSTCGESADSRADACRSLSCLTDSTDRSAPVHFDMSNRAKLPRGIENIRPHIAQVDNVPLLVSLFTDCTASSVQQMIQIMQDYDEVVCVMGSAANCHNMEIFMQADASIAVEPLYPVLCQKMPPYQVPEKCIGPIDLARALNSVPCSLSMGRVSDVALFALITMSRHFTSCLCNMMQFWMCAACFISLLHVCGGVAALPAAGAGAALCAAAAAAALAGGLALCAPHAAVMSRARTKNHRPLHQMAFYILWSYACKFIPSIISILTLYGFTLRSFCDQISAQTKLTQCWFVYPVIAANATVDQQLTLKNWHGWENEFYDGYYLAQHITLTLTTLHLIVISMSFVHRHSCTWQRGFWTNHAWCLIVVVILIVQSAFSASMLSTTYGSCAAWKMCDYRYWVAAPLLVMYATSLLIVFAINELIKWYEIRVDERNQRRARLDFGTKLGMNSPF